LEGDEGGGGREGGREGGRGGAAEYVECALGFDGWKLYTGRGRRRRKGRRGGRDRCGEGREQWW